MRDWMIQSTRMMGTNYSGSRPMFITVYVGSAGTYHVDSAHSKGRQNSSAVSPGSSTNLRIT